MSHLKFWEWVNNYPHIASAAKGLSSSYSSIHLYPFGGFYWGRSILTLQYFKYEFINANKSNLMLFYQVYKRSNITEYLRATWKLIVESSWLDVCVCVCTCICVCVFISFHCKGFSWLSKSIDDIPVIRSANVCWGNIFVSKIFVATS